MPSYNTITFENNKIIVIIDNIMNIWFNAKQICISLGYVYPQQIIIKNVDREDKIQLKNMDINFKIQQQPDSIYINETGLYSLLFSSRTKKAKKFIRWIKKDILPLVRQNNIYSTDNEITKLQKKINQLEKENKILHNDLKLEKFPDGAMVYIVEEYVDGEMYYKLGETDDMNKRISIYNTHSLHNKKVAHYVEVLCPVQLETCIRSMLYKYRYKNRKDYFKCSLSKAKKAFTECVKSIKCVETQDGGNKKHKVMYYENKLNDIYEKINIASLC